MGGRGRGRRRNYSNNVEGLEVSPGELPPCLQPPPCYPSLENHPAPINLTPSAVIQLGYKVDLLSYLSREVKQLNYAWKYFPYELRPGQGKRPAPSSENLPPAKIPATDINNLLAQLEKKEEAAQVKVEVEEMEEKAEKEDDAEEHFDDSDEEMDNETDYNQNYFDNGEGYLDEDDDGDESPVY